MEGDKTWFSWIFKWIPQKLLICEINKLHIPDFSPQKKNAKQISDFRPMSLVESVYKILPKVLTNHLSKILNSIIGENQQVFVQGRQITDAIIMTNQIVDEVYREKKKKPRYSM